MAAERFLSVTFLSDETVGDKNHAAGTSTSLPESIARGLGRAVTINGVGSAVLHNTASQQASVQAMVSGYGIVVPQGTAVIPTLGAVVLGTVQFRGAADTAASLGALGIVLNADNDGAAAADLAAGTPDVTSTINGASTQGGITYIPSTQYIRTVHIGEVLLTPPYSVVTASPVLGASKQFAKWTFAEADQVASIQVIESGPTNYAGASGTGSARMVTVVGMR